MVAVKNIFKDRDYAPFIKDNAIFKKIKTVKKIFPAIGLPNFEQDVVIDNTASKEAYAARLLSVICSELDHRSQYRLDEAAHRLCSVSNLIKSSYTKCIEHGRITSLKLPADILDSSGKITFKAKQSIFSVYDALRKEHNMLAAFENLQAFKDFSSVNISNEGMRLTFSSDGPDGIWDIATMSMRGIKSCQSWNSGDGNSRRVVGSMIDPFTGIIYLTSAKGKAGAHGRKMLRRCLVRYAISPGDGIKVKDHIILEKMYPAYDAATYKVFVECISEKTGLKVTYNEIPNSDVRIPISRSVSKLNTNEVSYRDSGIEYGSTDKSTYDYARYSNEINAFKTSIKTDNAWSKLTANLRRNLESYPGRYVFDHYCMIPIIGHLNAFIPASSQPMTTINIRAKFNAIAKKSWKNNIMNSIAVMRRDYSVGNATVFDASVNDMAKTLSDDIRAAAKKKADSMVVKREPKTKPSMVYERFL